jgi:hypothetical protein
MGKDFVKFMVLVVIVYCGFLTTFSLIGRDKYDMGHMTLILTKIFFGNSGTGLDIMDDIDPIFGPPLMVIFITLSSILLMGSLTGMLSNSFSRVITHAREEYLYVYSVYVLEASTSNRLTHFYPPFNLLALLIFRPLRLFLPSHNKFRQARIILLKATHLPIVATIQIYELCTGRIQKGSEVSSFGAPRLAPPSSQPGTLTRPRSARPSTQSRPQSAYQPEGPVMSSRRPVGHAKKEVNRGPSEAEASAAENDALGASSNYAETRIVELSEKIDRLTELVLRLQSQQTRPLTDL